MNLIQPAIGRPAKDGRRMQETRHCESRARDHSFTDHGFTGVHADLLGLTFSCRRFRMAADTPSSASQRRVFLPATLKHVQGWRLSTAVVTDTVTTSRLAACCFSRWCERSACYLSALTRMLSSVHQIFGIVLISVAAVGMTNIDGFAGADTSNGNEVYAILITIGVLIIVIAAFGCFGAWKESPKLLYIFAACLIVIILLELSVSVAATVMRPKFEETMKNQLRDSFYKNKSAKDENTSHKNFWDTIQSTCCGVRSPEDYSSNLIPYSCCMPENESDKAKDTETKRIECLNNHMFYQEGCEDKVLGAIHSNRISMSVTGLLFCFIEVVGVILALWLAYAIKNQDKSRETA
ncbi:Tetraspanin-6 [Eumeta japonica]|uniref:Tetraspanin-6 n=1 Tax=Eumeta variegata TaxID=151549 RepID=A0A4C1Y068_EUMVA|nr:Tetraspanin-6 [Eumeta japonica]